MDGHRARTCAGTGSDSGSELGRPPHARGRRKHEGPCPENGQADSRSRPLRRRAAMIPRPARVRIRRRNPCVLARRRLFGWKVRLLTAKLHQKEGKARWRRPHTGGRSSLRSPARPVKLAPIDADENWSRRHAERRRQITDWLWRTACWRLIAAVSVRRHRLFPSSSSCSCGRSTYVLARVPVTVPNRRAAWLRRRLGIGPQSVDADVDDGQWSACGGTDLSALFQSRLREIRQATVGEPTCQRR